LKQVGSAKTLDRTTLKIIAVFALPPLLVSGASTSGAA
jgi:hypothetical protein